MSGIAVITVAKGRHEHLRRQLQGLRRSASRPDQHVVVAMDDPDVREVCAGAVDVLDVRGAGAGLPLAEARNAGAAQALQRGADVLVFLDVDCIPGPSLLDGYAEALRHPLGAAALCSGPVVYLPPPPRGGYVLDEVVRSRDPHPARTFPPEGELRPLAHELFWSLSFATTARTWLRIGGFCTAFRGYGGEDTDLALTARERGVAHVGVGGAWAFHQWHPTADPPVQHLGDILRNGRLFRDRWGHWPMQGWLREFAASGAASYDPVIDEWSAAARRPLPR